MEEREMSDQEPTPPANVPKPAEVPQMSELAMIGNVFIEPGAVFEDQRRKPRFVIAGILIILAISAFQVVFIQKFGLENIARARVESSPRMQELPKEQKEKMIEQQSGPIATYATYGILPVAMIVIFLLGGLIYWLGSNAMGGTATFGRGIAVWIYSSWPPALVFSIANLIVMFLKDPDNINLATSQGGVLKASLAFFLDEKSMPGITAFVGAFDLFSIWGWILAAIGLQKVAKISSGAAWSIVGMLAVLGIAAKVVGALFF